MLVALVLGGCALVPAASADQLVLEANNGTTLDVTLVVNADTVAVFRAGTAGGLTEAQLPPAPWRVEARTPSGRVLLAFEVEGGPVDDQGQWRGAGARVDLSCGRLDVWSGPPIAGPPPIPGDPGDCEP